MAKKALSNDRQKKSENFIRNWRGTIWALGLYREEPYRENRGHQTITSTLEIKS